MIFKDCSTKTGDYEVAHRIEIMIILDCYNINAIHHSGFHEWRLRIFSTPPPSADDRGTRRRCL